MPHAQEHACMTKVVSFRLHKQVILHPRGGAG